MKRILPLLLFLMCLFPATLFAQNRSPIIGLRCPELQLEDYMLQGETLTQLDFEGKVVFVDIFQFGCPGCMKNSMPHLQALWEKYKDHPDVVILAINTAFEKGMYPIMGDEDNTRKYLKENKYTMPVARDKDERTVKLFRTTHPSNPRTLTYGTPIAFVVDADGLIVAHDWNGTEESTKALVAKFEESLKTVYPEMEKVDDRFSQAVALLKARKFGEAWAEIDKVKKESGPISTIGKDAETLHVWVTDYLETGEFNIEDRFYFNPPLAIQKLRKLQTRFKGVPYAEAFTKKIEEWEASDENKSFIESMDSFHSIMKAVNKAGYYLSKKKAEEYIDGLQVISEKSANRAATLADEEIFKLRAAYSNSGFMGVNVDQKFEGPGVHLTHIMEGGPGEKYGLKKDDILLTVNGDEIPDLKTFFKLMGKTRPSKEVKFTIQREGSDDPIDLTMTLGRRF